MNNAITNGANWSSSNTQVTTEDGVSYVYLHGNLIAEVDDNGIKMYDGGWQSNTTKSRLNAILDEHGIAGEGVFQKNWTWFVRLYNGTEFFNTEFRSGMRLGALTTADLLVWVITISPSYRRFMTTNPVERWGFLLCTNSSNGASKMLNSIFW